MDIKHLEVFLTLSQNLHFGRTAERHALSSSALTRMVQRLEVEAGTALFERDNRQVNLTDAGIAYAAFARKVLNAWGAFRQGLPDSVNRIEGEVSLFCSVTASHSLLNPLLSSVRETYPLVDIRVHTGDQAVSLQRLKQQTEDFVIAARPQELPAGTLFKRRSASELVFIAPEEGPVADTLAKAGSESWRDLPWVLAERGLSRQRLDHWFRAHRIKPKIYAQVSGHEAITSMVSLGFGVGLIPELVLSNSPVSGKIKVFKASEVMQSEAFEPFELGLCVLKRKLASPLLQAIWDSVDEN